jgi:hypothetical protein
MKASVAASDGLAAASRKYCSILHAGVKAMSMCAGEPVAEKVCGTRREDGLAGAKVETLVADLEDHLALHDVKPLLLGEMHVQCRA